MRIARQLVSDFLGLWRVCGFVFAMKWGWQVLRHLGQCRRRRDLQPADLALGNGPFHARLGKSQAKVAGAGIVTGIREIWVRDCYLADGFLEIRDGDLVLDLGANIGTFTMLALGHGPNVRVLAVEPNGVAGESLVSTARLHLSESAKSAARDPEAPVRFQWCRVFLGGNTRTQEELMVQPAYRGSRFLPQDDFIQQFGLTKIDFLKCDIEGSEFELLTRESPLLKMSRQLAIELHTAYGDVEAFRKMLEELGFLVNLRHSSPTDCILNARRPS